MKIRLLANPPTLPMETLHARVTKCGALIDAYVQARTKTHDRSALLSTRLEISLFVPPGVYCFGGDPSKEMYAVLGVQETGTFSKRDTLFTVPYTRIHGQGGFYGEWFRSPLVGSEGVLVPVARDEYRGQRFIRIGELFHE